MIKWLQSVSVRHSRAALVPLVIFAFLAESCAEERSNDSAVPHAPSAAARSSAASDRQMESVASGIMAFLQGRTGLDTTIVADRVILYVSDEGGGGHISRSAAELTDPNSWAVQSNGVTYTFVPPRTLSNVTTKAGVHFVCRETTLSSRARALVNKPHVGVLLNSADKNCLQTWNATFVFDTSGMTPQLVAAVYDQWEW